MNLNVKAVAIALGLVWGVLAMFLTGLVNNLIWPGYGQGFLEVMASVYPGYKASGGLGDVLVGTLYGFVDGAVIGAVYAWLYNRFAGVGVRSV
jgi:hypothetical protein